MLNLESKTRRDQEVRVINGDFEKQKGMSIPI
jgi:hypothetical protein